MFFPKCRATKPTPSVQSRISRPSKSVANQPSSIRISWIKCWISYQKSTPPHNYFEFRINATKHKLIAYIHFDNGIHNRASNKIFISLVKKVALIKDLWWWLLRPLYSAENFLQGVNCPLFISQHGLGFPNPLWRSKLPGGQVHLWQISANWD